MVIDVLVLDDSDVQMKFFQLGFQGVVVAPSCCLCCQIRLSQRGNNGERLVNFLCSNRAVELR